MPAADFKEIMVANRQRTEYAQAGQKSRSQELQKLLRVNRLDKDTICTPIGHKPNLHEQSSSGRLESRNRDRHPGVAGLGREERAARS